LKRLTITVVGLLALAAPAVASARLVGTFATRDQRREAGVSQRKLDCPVPAAWRLRDRPERLGAVLIGHTTASAAEIILANESGALACKKPGGYHWAPRRKKLTVKAVQHSCTGRRTVLTAHALIKAIATRASSLCAAAAEGPIADSGTGGRRPRVRGAKTPTPAWNRSSGTSHASCVA
jgi:hypothetical protein